MAKIVKKPAKFFMGPQMFSGDELDIRGLWEKKGEFFHHIIMISGSKSEKIRGEFSDFFCFCRNFCTQGRKTTFVEKNFSKILCSINERIFPESIKIFPFIQKKLFFTPVFGQKIVTTCHSAPHALFRGNIPPY